VEWDHQHGRKLQRTTGIGSADINPVWRKLWGIKVPSKVKKFAWKALHGTLPCRAILANRHIKTSGQCPVCSSGAEDIRHALFTCERAAAVWKALGLENIIAEALLADRAGQVSLEHLICMQQQKSPVLGHSSLQVMILVGAWYIWWERRLFLKEGRLQPPQRAAMSITVLASNFTAVASSKRGNMKKLNWKKPLKGMVKLNVDASFFEVTASGATGAVLRDDRGMFIGASSQVLVQVLDAESAEALALHHGLLFAMKMGCNRVEINSDNHAIIDAMNLGGYSMSPAATILNDCAQLARDFVKATFVYCPKDLNSVADEVAKHANDAGPARWIDDPPHFILAKLVSDLTIIE
jgi:ribonuclease HI